MKKKGSFVSSYGNLQKYRSKNLVVKILLNGFLKNLSRVVNSAKITDILDLGCGEGLVIDYLKKHNAELSFKGLDVSEEAIKMAKEINPQANFKVGDIYKLEYEHNSFDLIMMIEVLEHLRYPERVLTKIKDISRKFFVFSVPREPYFSIGNFMRGKNMLRWGSDLEHLQWWTKSQFLKLIKEHFKIIEVKDAFPWIIVLCSR